jgi:hypothetical protein
MNLLSKTEEYGQTLQQQMVEECVAMAKHALAAGLNVPGDVVETLEKFTKQKAAETPTDTAAWDIKQLNAVHNRLAKIVEPATPRTILLLDKESQKKGIWKFLGAVPFIRRLMLVAIISLVLFILISLSPFIDDNAESWNLFKASGLALLLRELFLLCAAALGASFAALFRANRYVVTGTFDPKYESTYWLRLVLGVIAGMLLATLVPIGQAEGGADFSIPLLAMLGGFSADVVYQILTRLVEAVASLVRGDAQRQVDAQRKELKARASEEESKNRFQLASNLMDVQNQIDSGLKPDEVKNKIKQMVNKLTETESGEG